MRLDVKPLALGFVVALVCSLAIQWIAAALGQMGPRIGSAPLALNLALLIGSALGALIGARRSSQEQMGIGFLSALLSILALSLFEGARCAVTTLPETGPCPYLLWDPYFVGVIGGAAGAWIGGRPTRAVSEPS
ncbi:MAG: hypothetical protein HYY05_07450 [Chloroflexi bacterium]|nr:hypothetical protein [Chloroflexota bacterium]